MDKTGYTTLFLQEANRPVDQETVKQHQKLWWWSFRNKPRGGLRLTDAGLAFIIDEADIHTYKIEFPKEFGITPQILIWLDHYINSPFHITQRHITVIKEREAFELYLLSGDVSKMGHNKAMNKRLSQE